jgi:MFS transporter, ACS family, glucarate transporter
MSIDASWPGRNRHNAPSDECIPTNVRWRIIGLLTIIAGLTYLDRLNLSIAGKYIQDEFGFSVETMGWVFSAFVWGYALFQTIGGWAGDRYGPRVILTVAIAWWSILTAATGIAARLPLAGWLGVAWSFAIVRFLIGAGEAATFPNANKIVALWMGSMQRSIGISLPIAGIGLGGAVTPLLITWIMQRWGWRLSFYLCGLLGLGVAVIWFRYVRNRPEEHRGVNAAELSLLSGTGGADSRGDSNREDWVGSRPPWGRMLLSRSVWALMLSGACLGYSIYIFHTWFFIYLVRSRGLSIRQTGVWGCAPYVAIAMLAPLGGWLSDRSVREFGARRGRRYTMWLGLACSTGLLLTGSHEANATLAILLLAGAAGFNLFSTATLFATCSDVAPRFAGTLSGFVNMCASFGGALSPIVAGRIAARLGWNYVFDVAALVTFAAGILWVFVDADEVLSY